MENVTNRPEATPSEVAAASRRSFLRVAGAAAVTGGLLSACSNADQTSVTPSGARAAGPTVALPTGDVGILAFAYVLEQLEAAFYEMILAKPYPNMSSTDKQLWADIGGHEIIHRALFKAAVGSAVPDLTFNFSSIDFNNRADVLIHAEAFEKTGVGAYNGAGKYIKNADYLTLAGKIVSVETRHHSIIRELQYPHSDAFAGPSIVTSDTGLHLAYEPTFVLPIAQKYINETLDASALVSSLA
ncbi:ferritin-like domain-containing protein [Spirosoma fluviale]|uniref:Tat (Twin-arginine translocation) pathway signal sequence n=1 Tax=Spirosoma fluviale TaxID=1597977 RepID=A0A286GL43_9BACT|nr:ferritin-like domain-containing protein [Spirosoma fluviale]SOD95809.1 Tat (twin-arginine translocation) pathway signal sequence [Spirosoma fluviale]